MCFYWIFKIQTVCAVKLCICQSFRGISGCSLITDLLLVYVDRECKDTSHPVACWWMGRHIVRYALIVDYLIFGLNGYRVEKQFSSGWLQDLIIYKPTNCIKCSTILTHKDSTGHDIKFSFSIYCNQVDTVQFNMLIVLYCLWDVLKGPLYCTCINRWLRKCIFGELTVAD